MDLDRTPAGLADAAAQELRALTHITVELDAYAGPGQVSETVRALAQLAESLPQVLDQLIVALSMQVNEGRVGTDDGTDPDQRVLRAVELLGEARDRAAVLASGLGAAAEPLAHLGTPGAVEAEEGED